MGLATSSQQARTPLSRLPHCPPSQPLGTLLPAGPPHPVGPSILALPGAAGTQQERHPKARAAGIRPMAGPNAGCGVRRREAGMPGTRAGSVLPGARPRVGPPRTRTPEGGLGTGEFLKRLAEPRVPGYELRPVLLAAGPFSVRALAGSSSLQSAGASDQSQVVSPGRRASAGSRRRGPLLGGVPDPQRS